MMIAGCLNCHTPIAGSAGWIDSFRRSEGRLVETASLLRCTNCGAVYEIAMCERLAPTRPEAKRNRET